MQYDMSQEKEPKVKKLLDEGKRIFKILEAENSISKSGNEMVVVKVEDQETKYQEKLYLVSVQGKRWLLKKLLTACGVKAGSDGIYELELTDIIDKEFLGEVIHEPNEYINRNGETVKTTQHRIVDFEIVEWDHDK